MTHEENSTVWYLKQIDLFEGITDEEIMAIAKTVVERSCTKKELLYTPFETTDSICMLKKGEVTLYHSHYGKKIIIDTLKPARKEDEKVAEIKRRLEELTVELRQLGE